MRIYFQIFILSAILVGCIPSYKALQTKRQLPKTFVGDTSSNSIGQLSVKDFFKDEELKKLIDTALTYNPDLNSVIQRISIARANYSISKWSLFPSFNARLSAGVEKYGDYTMNGVGNFDTNLSPNINDNQKIPNPVPDYFLGLNSSWEIDVWGRLRNLKKAAYKKYLASEKAKQLTTSILVASIAESYYTLVVLDKELEIINNNIKLQQKAVETVQLLKEGGKTNELAVDQMSAQLLNTKSLKVEIEQIIIETENHLNFLAGRFPQPINRGTTLEKQFTPEIINAGIPATTLLRRPDIQESELLLKASENEVKAARAAFLPALNITSYSAYNSFNASLLFNTPSSLAYGVLSGLTGPIFNRNSIRSNFRSSIANNREAYFQYQKNILKAVEEVNSKLKRIENYNIISSIKRDEVNMLHQAVTSSNDLFMAGYASYLEVIIAQKNVLEAEIGLINAQKEQLTSTIELYRALGGGWE